MNFADLHHQHAPLVMANVWDGTSASIAQQAGYRALGTSSAAIAAMLGYEDGEGMTFEALLFIVTRIAAVTRLPLSVDIEAGYGATADEITENIQRLALLGVAGVNIEDSRVVNGVRRLEDAHRFAGKLAAIRQRLAGLHNRPFLNIRTDTYLLNQAQALHETRVRGQLYKEAGADGLFVPCLTTEADIDAIIRTVDLPLNLMCMPDLPGFGRLQKLGVKRISMGNFLHTALQTRLRDLMDRVDSQQTFAGVFTDESAR